MMRDSRIESLMVIGYNPSHSNINSEVNAPFKILSTLLRFIDNESKGEGPNKTSLAHRQVDYDDEEDHEDDKKPSNL
jgi:importin-9